MLDVLGNLLTWEVITAGGWTIFCAVLLVLPRHPVGHRQMGRRALALSFIWIAGFVAGAALLQVVRVPVKLGATKQGVASANAAETRE
jgi:hypothetical protein